MLLDHSISNDIQWYKPFQAILIKVNVNDGYFPDSMIEG